jgi:hypothetical protein
MTIRIDTPEEKQQLAEFLTSRGIKLDGPFTHSPRYPFYYQCSSTYSYECWQDRNSNGSWYNEKSRIYYESGIPMYALLNQEAYPEYFI